MTTQERINDIEQELKRTQNNKATNFHICQLKAQLAKLKRELIEPSKKQGAGDGFDVNKSGDARVGMIGFPSVGKSTLLSNLTETKSKVASYEFTTLTCIPGNIYYNGSKIQLLDLPGIIEGAKDGKGKGKQVISTARTYSTKAMKHKLIIENELEGFGIRLNKNPPKVEFKIKERGGIMVSKTVDCPDLNDDEIKVILKEYRISNADVLIREDITSDQFIDVIEGNRKYIPCIYAMNKIDDITLQELEILDKIPNFIPVSGRDKWNLDGLIESMWENLNLIRIYTKPKGENPDLESPVILNKNRRTMEDFCKQIHKEFVKEFRHAFVWGTSVKFQPQQVGIDHVLDDEDVVQVVKKI